MKHKNNWTRLKGKNTLTLVNNMILRFDKENNNATGQKSKTNKENES